MLVDVQCNHGPSEPRLVANSEPLYDALPAGKITTDRAKCAKLSCNIITQLKLFHTVFL